MKLVMIAGPNDPEIVDTEDAKTLAEVFSQFSTDEVGLFARTDRGSLRELTLIASGSVSRDDAHIYMRTVYALDPNHPITGPELIINWDRAA